MYCLITRLLLYGTLLTYGLAPLANQALPALAEGQAPNNHFQFDHLSIEQELSQNTVLCLLQDKHGFMWFGTQDGLNKYDGQRFTIYRHDEADERNSLPKPKPSTATTTPMDCKAKNLSKEHIIRTRKA